MTDTEKKIAEIREALEKATPEPWKLVMDSYDDEKDTHFPWMIINADGEEICDFSGGGDVKLENAHIMTNASEWLRFFLSELDKRDEENRKLREERDAVVEGYQQQVKYAGELMTKLVSAQQERNMYKSSSEAFYDRLKKVDEEREKLIECLRFYERLARGREVNDGGRRARTLLAEIGVTVE